MLFVIALALAGIALSVGLIPVHRYGVSCGSVLYPNTHDPNVADIYDTLPGVGGPRAGYLGGVADACDSARSDKLPWVISAGVLAGLAFVGSYSSRRHAPSPAAGNSLPASTDRP